MTGWRRRTPSTSSSSVAESSCDTTFGPGASWHRCVWSSRQCCPSRTLTTRTCTGQGTEQEDEGQVTRPHPPPPEGEQTPSLAPCLPGQGAHPTERGQVLTRPDDTDPWEQLLAKSQQVAGLAGAGGAQRAAVLWGESTEHPLRGRGTRRGEPTRGQWRGAGRCMAQGVQHAWLLKRQPICSLVLCQS